MANYLAFDSRRRTEPGQGVNCLWKGIPVNCGPKGLPTDTNLLYRNLGDGRFADVSEASGIARVRNRYPMSVVAADLDEDGWVDLYVASDSTAAIHYRNNQDGTFSDVAVARRHGVQRERHGAGRAWAPPPATSTPMAGSTSSRRTLPTTSPRSVARWAAAASRRSRWRRAWAAQNRYVEWGAGLVDLDNDGWQDLLYVTGNVYPEVERQMPDYPHNGPRIVFRNRGGGSFEDVSALERVRARRRRGRAAAPPSATSTTTATRTCWS